MIVRFYHESQIQVSTSHLMRIHHIFHSFNPFLHHCTEGWFKLLLAYLQSDLISKAVQGGDSVVIWVGFNLKEKQFWFSSRQRWTPLTVKISLVLNLFHLNMNSWIMEWLTMALFQDNASMRKSVLTSDWFSANTGQTLFIPPKSFDRDPMKNMWWIFVHHVYENRITFDSII